MDMRDATSLDRSDTGRPSRWAATDRPASDALAGAIADVGTSAGPRSIPTFVDRPLPFTSSLVTVFDRHRPPAVLYDDKVVFFMPVIAALLLRQWDRAPSGGGRRHGGGEANDHGGLHPVLDEILKRGEFHCLTAREREIIALLLKGHSSKSIARCLGIAVGTVKNHRKNVYRKLSITSQSVLFARFLRLVDMR